MQIYVRDESCVYVYDSWYDDVEIGDDYERVHLQFRCRHDNIYYDEEIKDMWCPDCEGAHLSTDERAQYLEAHFEEGEYE